MTPLFAKTAHFGTAGFDKRKLHALMRELRGKGRNEVEAHIDDPASSEIFKAFPSVLGDPSLLQFICDYVRLIIMGNARTHEIEALMDEEIHTIVKSKLAPYHAMVVVAEALPAAGERVAIVGCGTSYFMAQAAAVLRETCWLGLELVSLKMFLTLEPAVVLLA